MSALVASVDELKTTSHSLEMTTPRAEIHAAVNPAQGEGKLVDKEGASEFDETVQHGQVWLQINIDPTTNKQLGIPPDKWMALDMKRLPKKNALPIPADGSDPIDMPGILAGVTNVKQTSATSYAGTIDLTKITGRNTPDPTEVRRAGVAATRAPFNAATDANNRLTEFNINTTAFDPGLSLKVTYANYGANPNVRAPSSSVPAPPSLYLVLSN